MSSQGRGFVRDSRFGSGQVISGTNRDTTRKWRELGDPFKALRKEFTALALCSKCGQPCCNCPDCISTKGDGLCGDCANIPGVRSA